VNVYPFFLLIFALSSAAAETTGGKPAKNPCKKLLTTVAAREQSFVDSHSKQIQKRSFGDYEKSYGSSFSQKVLELNENEIWLDVGSGQIMPQRQYHEQRTLDRTARATTYAIDYFSPTGADYQNFLKTVPPEKFHFLGGRYFQDIPSTELPRANLITDYFGAATYADHLDQTLIKEISLLKVGSSLFLHLAGTRLRITDTLGRRVSLQKYLKLLKGVNIRATSASSFQIVRIHPTVGVPELQFLYSVDDGHPPPIRYYTLQPVRY
jgi:hypothetical protein